MAAPLATCTEEEQRFDIHFLRGEGVKPSQNHQWMEVQYSDACLSLQQVYKWSRKFLNGVSSVTDSPRPGQAHRVVTPEAIAVVEAIVKENHHITVHEIAAHLYMSHGSAHHIVHDVLQFHKVCKVGAKPADCRIERTTCWCLPETFETLSRKNCYWRWNLGPLPPAGNQESEQGMAPYLLTKTEKIPHNHLWEKLCWLSFGMNEG